MENEGQIRISVDGRNQEGSSCIISSSHSAVSDDNCWRSSDNYALIPNARISFSISS